MNTLQLENLRTTALSLFETSRGMFWHYLPIVFLLAIMMIFLSGEVSGTSFERLFKRLIVAILLLCAFPKISDAIVGIEDHLVVAFGGEESLQTIFLKVADHAKEIKVAGTSFWFKFGQIGLTVIATLSFLILSIVHHFLDVLHLTTWNLLHILGPLALLGSLFPSFSQVPKGIFLGMFELSLWRPVWVIMGRILIAIGFGDSPNDPSQWFDTAVMNFAVAGLLASTPALVHGFLNGSLASIGGGALQTMIGGAGAFLAQLPVRAIQGATGGAAKIVGLAGSGVWTATGGKWAAHQARPHIAKAASYASKRMPNYWFPNQKSKSSAKE